MQPGGRTRPCPNPYCHGRLERVAVTHGGEIWRCRDCYVETVKD